MQYTELTKDDLKWRTPNSTCVETQTFYITADSGHFVLAQVIYSNVGYGTTSSPNESAEANVQNSGLRTTCQFSTKVFYPDDKEPFLWASDSLSHWGFDDQKYSFHADNCSITLSEDGNSYTIKSSTSKKAIVNLTFRRTAPGIQAGKDGTTNYGTDPKQPWGTMMHAFWPRCKVTGSIITPKGELVMEGLGMYIHALQGLKPNFAGKYFYGSAVFAYANRWFSCNLELPQLSIIQVFSGHHGIHHASLVRIDQSKRGLHCYGRQDHYRRKQRVGHTR